MTMVDVGDTALSYEVSGHGPARVFMHGMCGDGNVWAEQAARFSDQIASVPPPVLNPYPVSIRSCISPAASVAVVVSTVAVHNHREVSSLSLS